MKPDPAAAPADPQNLLRQQLILAQVRIMELEDTRDELAPKIASLERLLAAAQTIADQKTAEAAHLERVRADLQQQFEHLRHMQHVTNQALEDTRASLKTATGRERDLLSEVEQLQGLIAQQAEIGREQQARHDELATRLQAATAEAASRLERMHELDAEQRAIKASRSWRWTAWLRSLERAFGGRKP
jgi:chromosome segregation ATPase